MKDSILQKGIPVAVLLSMLCGCGGGGGSDTPATPPSSPSPPTVPPPPPPPPASTVPPLSSTVVDITDNHTIGTFQWNDRDTDTGGQGSPVAGLDCLPAPIEDYHVHAHVSVFLNGEAKSIPADIGIVRKTSGNCFYAIHTHDKSGKIHVETAAPGMFTLGMLFQIWGQPLTNTNIAGITGLPVQIFVTDNGTVTEVKDNWTDIELKSKREITISVGTLVTEIPNITWTGN